MAVEACMRIQGKVHAIKFCSQNGDGFQIVDLKCTDGKSRTVKGKMPILHEGETIALIAKQVYTEQWGSQFEVREFAGYVYETHDSLVALLASKRFKGVDKQLGKAAVAHFGLDIFKVLDEDPSRIREVKGVGLKRADAFVASYQAGRADMRLDEELVAMGLSVGLAAKARAHFEGAAVEIIRSDPYSLTEIDGVGFLTADQVATLIGLKPNDPRRVRAAIVYVADSATSGGHCYLEYHEVVRQVEKLTKDTVLASSIRDQMKALEADGQVVRDQSRVYAADLYAAEKAVAEKLAVMLAQPRHPVYEDEKTLLADLSRIEEMKGSTLGEMQTKAAMLALDSPVTIITGGPGTGKSHTTRAVCALLESCGYELKLCAPTGRAAKRLSEATGRRATTIHMMLQFGKKGPVYHSGNFLNADVVIVDEFSMTDIKLFRMLLSSLDPSTRIVMIGDADQLPSVGPGNVLRDLIKTKLVPTVRLDQVYRQAQGSYIVDVAYDVINGRIPDIPSPKEMRGRNVAIVDAKTPDEVHAAVARIVTKVLPSKGFDPKDIQVLSPMRKNALGVEALNVTLQEAINPPSPAKAQIHTQRCCIREGDKVMQTKNNYKLRDEDGVFNGDIGTACNVDEAEDFLEVYYPDYDQNVEYQERDLPQLQLAYATTVHKAQGAEFGAVVIVLHPSHTVMLQRNLLYTAITRSKRLCAIVGTKDALVQAVSNNREIQRNTSLPDRLREAVVARNV
jgi:exodeoxyribonuclease V alpha subunit